MSKDKIIKNYKKLFDEYLKYNDYYFNKDNPLVSDYEYDNLKKVLLELENSF